MKENKGTKTSSFGVSGRTNHDSSKFYKSRLYQMHQHRESIGPYEENEIPPGAVNEIFCKSSEKMDDLPDNSVHLMVTSPPYNVGKDYDQDLSLEEYNHLLESVWRETYRVLIPGGRACINIANVGRKPYIPLHAHIINSMLQIGFLMRGEIIWNKGASSGSSCAWGSWRSPSNPVLRDVHEYILIFSKENFSRKKLPHHEADISRDEFLEYTKSIWTFNAESAQRVKHPAPFPVELPTRCIKLYTFKGDVVLDPFMGCGTTAIAALNNDRAYVGYDIEPEFVDLCHNRIEAFHQTKQQLSLFPETSKVATAK